MTTDDGPDDAPTADPTTHPRDRREFGGTDPTAIRSIAVHASDVVSALEARLRGSRPAVLRVLPPFAARMRARLHVEGGEGGDYDPETAGDARPIHVDPRRLVEKPPPYPEADETADALRSADEYSPETHHERHVAAVEAWREGVRESFVDRVVLETGAGTHEVEVKVLG